MTGSSIRLDGKVALVTGATKGIGRAVAVALAGAGAAVVGSARNAGPAAELAEEIGQAGGTFTFVGADVSQWVDCQALAGRALETHGRVDILVNNAGTSLPHARLDEIDEAAWREVAGVTLDGTLFMTRAVLPAMIAQRDGLILNIASSAAVQTAPTMGAYAAAKAAVVQLARVVAVENVEHGIRANAILVGSTETELSDRARASFGPPADDAPHDATPSLSDGEASAIGALGSSVRLQPDGVARAVLALCADEAREITAATIALDRANVAGYSHGKLAALLAGHLARSGAR